MAHRLPIIGLRSEPSPEGFEALILGFCLAKSVFTFAAFEPSSTRSSRRADVLHLHRSGCMKRVVKDRATDKHGCVYLTAQYSGIESL